MLRPVIAVVTLLSPLMSLSPSAQEPESVAVEKPEPIRLGAGAHTYEWQAGWGALPEGKDMGNTHGCIVVDRKGRIYVNNDTEHAVTIFDGTGKLVGAWGKEFKGGLHGMSIVQEGDEEFLYLAHTGRREVVKTTLDGKVLWSLGVPKQAGVYEDENQYRPTSVVVAADGSLFVADGYGLSWVHQFDGERQYVRSFGGRGTEPGKMRTPHGLWIDTRGDEPRLIVCDRENHRLQIYDLEGKLLGQVQGMLRRPCNVHQHGEYLVVADLAGRVTILDGKNELVCHLGENTDAKKWAQNGVPREQWVDGQFISPHSARWDDEGNLYVMDWVAQGRITKLVRVR